MDIYEKDSISLNRIAGQIYRVTGLTIFNEWTMKYRPIGLYSNNIKIYIKGRRNSERRLKIMIGLDEV